MDLLSLVFLMHFTLRYGVLYAASHKNLSTAGVCYAIIRRASSLSEVSESIRSKRDWITEATGPWKAFTDRT